MSHHQNTHKALVALTKSGQEPLLLMAEYDAVFGQYRIRIDSRDKTVMVGSIEEIPSAILALYEPSRP